MAAEHDVALAFIQLGKPTQNAFIERFNRTYREAVLDAYLFHTDAEVKAITEDWLEEYNAIRPHESLGDVPPYHYAPKQPLFFHFQMVLKLGSLHFHQRILDPDSWLSLAEQFAYRDRPYAAEDTRRRLAIFQEILSAESEKNKIADLPPD